MEGPAPQPPCLVLERLSAGFQGKTILRELSFEIPQRGVMGVMGPSGVGKSTLLRTLSRWNEPLPSFWVDGDVRCEGKSLLRDFPLEQAQRKVPLLAQKAQLFTAQVIDNAIAEIRPPKPITAAEKVELARQVLSPWGLWDELEGSLREPVLALSIGQQRRLSIARLVAGGCVCLLVDEPLRDIPDEEVVRLKALLREVANQRAVLMVTHNQKEARELCDTIGLLVAGSMLEVGPATDFFREPSTEMGRDFIRFGNCWPSRPEEPQPEVSPEAEEPAPAPPVPEPPPRRRAPVLPGGFHWVIPGLLGGMQRPGLMQSLQDDLEGLRALGCKVLVNLTHRSSNLPELTQHGVEVIQVPIPDMGVPTLETAESLCRRISAWVDAGMTTVVHCKAGLGRTGTILACFLVMRGENAVRAVHRVRATNPYSIQTREQLAFIGEFGEYLEARAPELPCSAG